MSYVGQQFNNLPNVSKVLISIIILLQDEVGTKNLSAYSKPLTFEIPKQRIPNVPLPITPVILKVEQICGTFLKYDGKYTSETIIMSVIMHALFCTYYISSKDLVSARR